MMDKSHENRNVLALAADSYPANYLRFDISSNARSMYLFGLM